MLPPASKEPVVQSTQADPRSLYGAYATGLFSMGQAELLTLVVPLWALLLGASPTQIGTLVGARSLLTFFLAIHGGALMDRLGTRRVLMFFAAATGVVAASYPFLPWFPAMIVMQMLVGLAGNMTWIGAQTMIGEVTRGDPGQIGWFSFFARMGNVVTPLLIGLIWDIAGPTFSFLGIALWSCTLLLVTSQIPDVRVIDRSGRFSWREILPRLSDYTGSLRLIVLPAIAVTLAVSFIRHATNGVEASFFIVYLRELGFAAAAIGALFSIAEVVNGMSSLLAGRVARLMPIPWLMVGFTTLSAALLLITPFLGGVFILLALAQAVRRGCEGVVQPLMFSMQARAVARDRQGSVVGLRVTNNRLSSIITPMAMGVVVEYFGIENGFVIVGAVLLFACVALATVVARTPELRQ
ncbi:MAG TPA: MFS transporter [Xanthobacteraceae bacterium]|nr:MFS transporter [Xanthobacteraceae bacterium]